MHQTQGVGAKPETAEAVLSQFGPYDALAPMPLLGLELACGFLMPLVNLGSLMVDSLIPKATKRALPWLYRWRLSKMYFLYQNSLTPQDFKSVYMQWLASSVVLGHVVKRRLRASLPFVERMSPGAASPR